jgi:hypothetical protein
MTLHSKISYILHHLAGIHLSAFFVAGRPVVAGNSGKLVANALK